MLTRAKSANVGFSQVVHFTDNLNEVSIHRDSPVWFVHWLAIHTASPVCLYVDWLYTGLDGTYYNSVFL